MKWVWFVAFGLLMVFLLIGCPQEYHQTRTITLEWDDPNPPEIQVTHYNVYQGFTSRVYEEIGETFETTFVVESLDPGLTYYFAVTAENIIGEGGYSNEVAYF